MGKAIKPMGNNRGAINKPVLDLHGRLAGSCANPTLSSDAKAEHKARVRAASQEVMERHRSVFKKLAE